MKKNTADNNRNSFYPGRNFRLLTLFLHGLLVAASAFAGWIWGDAVGSGGEAVWFGAVFCCGIVLGVAVHQAVSGGRFLLTLLVLSAFVLASGARYYQSVLNPQAVTLQVDRPVLVEARKLLPCDFTERFSFSGIVEPDRKAVLSFAGRGLVATLLVQEGATVEKGEVLAELDDAVLQAQREEAAALLKQAVANRTRLEQLFAEDAASEKQYDDAQAVAAAAEARLEALKAQCYDMTLKAPFAGCIAERFIEEGEYAAPAAPAYTLLTLDPVKIVVRIPERMIRAIRPGARASVAFDALEDPKTFEGRITLVPPDTIAGTPLYAVEVTVENTSRRLKPGMAAEVEIEGRTYRNIVLLDIAWVRRAGGEHYVFQVAPVERFRSEFMEEHAVGIEALQRIFASVGPAETLRIARSVKLTDFRIVDDRYVVLAPGFTDPLVVKGITLLDDLSLVRLAGSGAAGDGGGSREKNR